MANKYEFSKGESVRIKVGVFRAFIGKVAEIHKKKSTLTVIVEVSGKPQSIELTFLEVEKLDRHFSSLTDKNPGATVPRSHQNGSGPTCARTQSRPCTLNLTEKG